MSELFDPYYKWLGIRPEEYPPDHYRLLGIAPFEHDRDVIANAAERQMVHVRSYQLGPHSDLSQKLLTEIAAARVCLLDPDKKAAYDASLRGQLAAQVAQAEPLPSTVASGPLVSPPLVTRPPIPVFGNRPRRLMLVTIGAVALCVGTVALFLSHRDEKTAARPTDAEPPPPRATAAASPTEPPSPEAPPATATSPQEHPAQREGEAVNAPVSKPAPTSPVVEQPVPSTPASLPNPKPIAAREPTSPAETPEEAERRIAAALAAANSPAGFRTVAEDCLKTVDQLRAKGEKSEVGKRLLTLALSAARKSRDNELIWKVTLLLVNDSTR